ncbi:MAG: hypothetical protein RMJ98_04710, partial [Myxococcales bacterium]|nr:hypothetical protein [Polyangiaceae bacterium]MDW8248593.1 hypothetical protein [Myxococcales bacterium]
MTADRSSPLEQFVRAADDTRLYLRYHSRGGSPLWKSAPLSAGTPSVRPAPPEPSSHLPTALLCDGIACDGFVWKYLWEPLSAWLPVAHWH